MQGDGKLVQGVLCVTTQMNSKELIKRVEKEGWELMSVTDSHHKFRHPGHKGRVIIPHPKKDFAIGILKNIYRQAGWKWKE